MIWKSTFLIGCTALAYAMLHGWPDTLGGVMRGCFAVLAWVAGLAAWTRRKPRENVATPNTRRIPRWPDYLVIGMAILAVESGFLWLLGAAPRPLESAGLAIERQFRPAAAALRAVAPGEAQSRPGNWLWTRETQRPLPKRTDFKPGTKPEVFLRLMDPTDADALPTRVAYGWAGGTWYESSGLFVFRANEAHAWTEIWLENHGWVLMDATPQSTGSAAKAQVAPPGEVLPGAADSKEPESGQSTTTETTLPRLGIWMMFGFGIPAGLIAWLRRWRSHDENGQEIPASSTAAAAPAYLHLWRHACATRGLPMPPGFTLRRQISRVPDPPDFAAELLDYHYSTRYEGRPVDARVEKHLARRIRAWETGFPGIKPDSEPHIGIP